MWKPWNYLVGTGDEEAAPEVAPSGPAGEEEPATKKTDEGSDSSRTSSPGE